MGVISRLGWIVNFICACYNTFMSKKSVHKPVPISGFPVAATLRRAEQLWVDPIAPSLGVSFSSIETPSVGLWMF